MASPLSYNLELSSLEAAHGLRQWLRNADGAEAVLLRRQFRTASPQTPSSRAASADGHPVAVGGRVSSPAA